MTSLETSARAALWDLDGTLIDSAGYHYESWQEILSGRGVKVDPSEFGHWFGKRNETILRDIFGERMSAWEIDDLSETKEALYRRMLRERGLELLPGAKAWLERLNATGWKQALATSAPRANVDAVLDILQIGRWLDGWVSADDVGKGKPDPDVFLAAARSVGVAPASCVVVEDAPAGVEGARRAGMRCIGVLSTHHAELRADVVARSLEDLPEDAFERLVTHA
jgi:beta-phosphoglucomutase